MPDHLRLDRHPFSIYAALECLPKVDHILFYQQAEVVPIGMLRTVFQVVLACQLIKPGDSGLDILCTQFIV